MEIHFVPDLSAGVLDSHPAALSQAVRGLARKALPLSALAAVLGALLGCSNIAGTTSVAAVKIVDASSNVTAIDVYQGSSPLAYNLGLGTKTSYVPIAPGTYTIAADLAGSQQALASTRATFYAGTQHTVIVGDALSGVTETVLADQTTSAPSGQIDLRFLDQASAAGAVDVYLIPSGSTILQVKPVLTNVALGANSGYLAIPAGTYTLTLLPAGTVATSSTSTSYTGPAVVYGAGTATTFVLVNQPLATTLGLQVVTTQDFDPVGSSN